MRKLGLVLLLWLGLAGLAQAQMVTVWPAPQGPVAIPLTISAQGTTGSFTATLPAATGKWTYICGFVLTSAGTSSATSGNATITGVPSTMNFTYVFVSSGQGILGVAFPGCISSSAVNTAIVITMPAGGAGTTAAISAWGYNN